MAGTDVGESGRPRARWKTAPVGALALFLTLAASACGSDVDRESYVAANDAVLAEFPVYPNATLSGRAELAYDDGSFRLIGQPPITGYTTLVEYEVQAAGAEIDQFFRRELSKAGWGLATARVDGLQFTKGNAGILIDWGTRDRSGIPPPSEVLHYVVRLDIDHNEFRNGSLPTMPPDAPPYPTEDGSLVPPAKQTAIAAMATAEAR